MIEQWRRGHRSMKHTSRCKKQRKHSKTRLRLPDLEFSKTAVLNSLTSADGQRGYSHAIDEFVDWYCSEPRLTLNRTVVLRYRSYLEARLLAPGTINLRLGAVRRLVYEAADSGLLSSDLAAGIRRVKGVRNLGVRYGKPRTRQSSKASETVHFSPCCLHAVCVVTKPLVSEWNISNNGKSTGL